MSDSDNQMPGVLSDDSSSQDNADQISEDEAPKRPFKKIFQGGKRGRAFKNDVDDDEEDYIDYMIRQMQQAAEKDEQANQNKKPAIHKLELLEKVVKFLKVQRYFDTFVNMNGHIVLSKWLEQLPDGSFPCSPIKIKLLRVISDLPISTDILKQCKLGRAVMAISLNKSEVNEVKKLSKKLVDKWSREIFEIENNYTRLEEIERYQNRPQQINLTQSQPQRQGVSYTRIPDRGLFDFKYRPVVKNDDSGQSNANLMGQEGSIERLKKKMSRKRTGRRRIPGDMSVDGRGLIH